MNDVNVQVIVKSPPSEIWKIWSNFAEAPLWDTDVRQCQLDGPFQAGTRGKCVLKNGLNMPLKLEAVSLHESYRNSARLLWIDLEFDHRMRRLSADETHVVHSAKISGPLSFLYRGLLRKALTVAMTTALDNLCTLAEQRAIGAPRHGKTATPLHLV
ncbi:SRPBCC family protein [Pseudomonas thivervalensis]|uniref:Polyketide cyclase n=1 Tax=Pseudomonas thivervalensis TaxID=86265 RepID=A0A2Z4Z663_9PSED|nr:polyketide cyclase [Pseudomonas thivervalensis]AXA53266.1 polyketide cyclase [Pseudomonas thivervalensis]AXA61000.1 polyketide cyclase [Pseudomonas thivervalensis]